jgi:hypothetical protein
MKRCPACGIHADVEADGTNGRILLRIFCPSCRHSGDGEMEIRCQVDDDDGSIAANIALGIWNALPPMPIFPGPLGGNS